MFSKRDSVLFLAGAQTFHTITHIFFGYSGVLPLRFWSIELTQQLNIYAIVINALIAVALLWWASKLK